METKIKTLKTIIKHADIQSLLDVKAFFGEISVNVLKELDSASEKVITVSDPKTKGLFFFVKTDKGYNLFSVLTSRMYKDLKGFHTLFKEEAPKEVISTVVYKGNKKLYNLLKDVGFSSVKEITTGVENRSFLLMEFDNE